MAIALKSKLGILCLKLDSGLTGQELIALQNHTHTAQSSNNTQGSIPNNSTHTTIINNAVARKGAWLT